ncbi:MAG: RNA polymerase sigma factor WhiG [bacterium]
MLKTKLKEEELWRVYKETEDEILKEELREEIILRYASLVKYIAGRIAMNTPPIVEFNDLVHYGIIGLIDAIEKFDLNQNIKFKTYAIQRIRGAILDELRIIDWVPRSVRQKSKELEIIYANLEHKLGRPATDEEVVKELGITIGELNKMISEVSGTTLLSLDDICPISDDNEVSVIETIEGPVSQTPEVITEKEEAKKLLIEAMERLPQREREVIALYYYEELTLKEIGEVLGITESRVSQLHTKIILRLRGYLSKHRMVFKEVIN